MQVYPRAGEHLVGHLAAAGRVGEVREPVAAYAAGEGQHRGGVRLTLRRSSGLSWGRTAKACAGSLGRAEPGTAGTFRAIICVLRDLSAAVGVGEVRHPVGVHAVGEGERFVLRRRRGGGRGRAAAAAGGEQRHGGSRDDGGEDGWTATAHDGRFLSVESGEVRSIPSPRISGATSRATGSAVRSRGSPTAGLRAARRPTRQTVAPISASAAARKIPVSSACSGQ